MNINNIFSNNAPSFLELQQFLSPLQKKTILVVSMVFAVLACLAVFSHYFLGEKKTLVKIDEEDFDQNQENAAKNTAKKTQEVLINAKNSSEELLEESKTESYSVKTKSPQKNHQIPLAPTDQKEVKDAQTSTHVSLNTDPEPSVEQQKNHPNLDLPADQNEQKVEENSEPIETRVEDGVTFEGVFKDGKLNGMGTIFNNENGDSVSGLFKDGMLIEGVAYSEGKKLDGKFEGFYFKNGIITHSDGLVEEGEFNDETLIEGTKKYPNGDVYTGKFEWFDGLKEGKIEYANGEVRSGKFSKRFGEDEIVLHGPDGTRITKDIKEEGKFFYGLFVEGIRTDLTTGVQTKISDYDVDENDEKDENDFIDEFLL